MRRLLPFALAALLGGCTPSTSDNASSSNVTPSNESNSSNGSNAVATNSPDVNATNGANAGNEATNGTGSPAPSSDDSRVYARKDLKVRTVLLAGKPFRLWIMDNGGKRQEGMMFLRPDDVEADQGMLFAFTDVQKGDDSHGFWMRNCPLELDIIYLSPTNKVVNIVKGEAYNETAVPPTGDYKNVIELKFGTAKRIGLKPGMEIPIPKDLKPTAD